MKAIIINTYSKNEKYIDHYIKALDILWPGHPEIWVISDKGDFRHQKRVIIKNASFTQCLDRGISVLLNRNILNFQDYILMIHEDHVPLENVDSRLMSKITEAAKKNKWKFIHLCELREKYLSKKGKRISEILNAEIFIIRDDYCWRSSSDPVIVEVDYLKSLTNQAIKEGLKSPWEFELMRESDQNHYVVDRKNSDKFIWPIVWSGFLIRGAVNGAAINRMNHPSLGSLKKMLVKDYLL